MGSGLHGLLFVIVYSVFFILANLSFSEKMEDEGHHERIRVALRAQGLATEGSLQDCIARLASSSTSKARKRKRDPQKTKASSSSKSTLDSCILNLRRRRAFGAATGADRLVSPLGPWRLTRDGRGHELILDSHAPLGSLLGKLWRTGSRWGLKRVL